MANSLRSSRLLPAEREALCNEILDQQHQYRQNMALLHGLPMPGGPHRVNKPAPAPAQESQTPMQAQQQPVDHAPVQSATPTATPAAPQLMSALRKAALVTGLLTTGAIVPAIGTMAYGWFTSDPPRQSPPITVPEHDHAEIDLLKELERRGLSGPPTDLGRDIEKAFQLNPALREQLLRDVQKTLEEHGAIGN